MKPFTIFLVLLMAGSMAISQTVYYDTVPFTRKQGRQPDFNLSAGTSFSTAGRYGSALTSWVTPSVSYPLGKRFSIHGGLSLVNEYFDGVRPLYGATEAPYSGNLTSAIIFIDGRYQLSRRLTLSGGAYKQIPLLEDSPGNSPFYRQDRQGYYLNAEYRVTDHFHIEAGFGYSKGNSPYRTDPFCSDPFRMNTPGVGFGY